MAVTAGFSVAFTVALPSPSQSAETKTLSVKMANTHLFSKPDMGSAKTATLQSGDLLELVEEAGMFYKVKTSGGETGFVPRMNVTPGVPPSHSSVTSANDDVQLDDLVGSLEGQQVVTLKDASSSHSMRGKRAAKPTHAISPEEADKSVETMESFTVTPEDVIGFGKEGNLEIAQ